VYSALGFVKVLCSQVHSLRSDVIVALWTRNDKGKTPLDVAKAVARQRAAEETVKPTLPSNAAKVLQLLSGAWITLSCTTSST
jgi:hypothetical protein